MKVLLTTHQHSIDNGLAPDRQPPITLTSTDQDALPHVVSQGLNEITKSFTVVFWRISDTENVLKGRVGMFPYDVQN